MYRSPLRRLARPFTLVAAIASAPALIAAPDVVAAERHETVPGELHVGTATYGGAPQQCTANPFITWEQRPDEAASPPLFSGPYHVVHYFQGGEPREVSLTKDETNPFNDAAIYGGDSELLYPAVAPGTHRWQVGGGNQGDVASCPERAAAAREVFAGAISVEVPIVTPDPAPSTGGDSGGGTPGGAGGGAAPAGGGGGAAAARAKCRRAKARLARTT